MAKTKKKISKEEAHYRDRPSNLGQQCLGCSMFKGWKCSLVRGDISQEGHCIYWEAK